LIDRDIAVGSDAIEETDERDEDAGAGAAGQEDRAKKQKQPKDTATHILANSTLYKTPGKDANAKSTKFKQFNFEKRSFTKLSCPLSHFDGYNLWLLKPTHLNRGRGIHVFKDLPTLHKLIREYCVGKDEESWKKRGKQGQDESQIAG